MDQNNLPTVAIVGRPNVGKSALFNAILRKRLSIVHEQSGVTRDCVASPAEYKGKSFLLVDTGGLGTWNGDKKIDLFDGMIRDQVTEVLQEASCLIWVVNCLEGITPQDEEVGAFLRKSGKPLILCCNKADNKDLIQAVPALFGPLGVKEMHPTTCTHTHGIEDLLKGVASHLPEVEVTPEAEKPLRIAVVGRPNVGKSSLVNALLGEDRMMVSDIAGTTRDSVDLPLVLHKKDGEELKITLVDTAGLRRKGQISTVVEFFSANRTELAIRSSDMVLFVLDSQEPCTTQERHIGRIISDARRPCIMLANKWDIIINEGNNKPKLFEDFVRNRTPYMAHAPILNISAKSGYNLESLFDHLKMVKDQMKVTVPTAVFNQFLQDILRRNPPSSVSNKRFKIFYGTMVHNPPPKFVLFVNDKKLCPKNYENYLENRLREAFFPQSGLPINLELRSREDPEGGNQGARAAAAGVHLKEHRYHPVSRKK